MEEISKEYKNMLGWTWCGLDTFQECTLDIEL